MNRILQYLNLLGVAVLAILLATQWQQNSHLNHDVDRLDAARLDLASKLADTQKNLTDTTASLDDAHQRLAISESALKDATSKLTAEQTHETQIMADNAQLKDALTKWTAAVQSRDDEIKEAGTEIQKLSTERNDAVQRFNDLVNKYNAVVAKPGNS